MIGITIATTMTARINTVTNPKIILLRVFIVLIVAMGDRQNAFIQFVFSAVISSDL